MTSWGKVGISQISLKYVIPGQEAGTLQLLLLVVGYLSKFILQYAPVVGAEGVGVWEGGGQIVGTNANFLKRCFSNQPTTG